MATIYSTYFPAQPAKLPETTWEKGIDWTCWIGKQVAAHALSLKNWEFSVPTEDIPKAVKEFARLGCSVDGWLGRQIRSKLSNCNVSDYEAAMEEALKNDREEELLAWALLLPEDRVEAWGIARGVNSQALEELTTLGYEYLGEMPWQEKFKDGTMALAERVVRLALNTLSVARLSRTPVKGQDALAALAFLFALVCLPYQSYRFLRQYMDRKKALALLVVGIGLAVKVVAELLQRPPRELASCERNLTRMWHQTEQIVDEQIMQEYVQEVRLQLEGINPKVSILVGISGAGKTAYHHEFARRVQQGLIRDMIGLQVYYTHGGILLNNMGMNYSDGLNKMEEIAAALSPHRHRTLVIIDEIGPTLGSGKAAHGMQTFFKTEFHRVTAVASTTEAEYGLLSAHKDGAVPRRLEEPIQIKPLSKELALRIARQMILQKAPGLGTTAEEILEGKTDLSPNQVEELVVAEIKRYLGEQQGEEVQHAKAVKDNRLKAYFGEQEDGVQGIDRTQDLARSRNRRWKQTCEMFAQRCYRTGMDRRLTNAFFLAHFCAEKAQFPES